MDKKHWLDRREAWAYALYDAADKMSPDTPLREILGSVAWGRYAGEPHVQELKDNSIFGAGYLEGVRDTALRAGRALKLDGTEHLAGIHNVVDARMRAMRGSREAHAP